MSAERSLTPLGISQIKNENLSVEQKVLKAVLSRNRKAFHPLVLLYEVIFQYQFEKYKFEFSGKFQCLGNWEYQYYYWYSFTYIYFFTICLFIYIFQPCI